MVKKKGFERKNTVLLCINERAWIKKEDREIEVLVCGDRDTNEDSQKWIDTTKSGSARRRKKPELGRNPL